MPQVSIIMPVKNAGEFLHECVESILDQTFSDWELIAVNDHSTDHSMDILEGYAQRDARVQAWQSTGSGIIDALVFAFSKCRGSYITRMDADDVMPPTRLELMAHALDEQPAKTVVTGLVRYFPEKEVSDGYRVYQQWLNETNLHGWQWKRVYRECVVASPNWMVRRADLVSINGFEGLVYPEDYHLVLRWYKNNFRVHCLHQLTLMWREHADRTSKNHEGFTQEAFFRLKIREFLANEPILGQLVLWGKNAKSKLAAKFLKEASIDFLWMQVTDYAEIERVANPKLLVAVYPEKEERTALELYLINIGLHEGRDWWYL